MRALKIVYRDHFSSFEKPLLKGKSVTVHERNLQILATEMYKTLNSFSPEIMKEILKLKLTTTILLMRSYFPKEMLKQLDMGYRPCLTWVLRFGTCTQRDEASYYSE